ncbi:MAG: c-type cytochrome [Polyangiaceae bacterium]
MTDVNAIAIAIAIASTVLAGCRTEQTLVTPDPHLERMLKQEKVLPYENDPLLPEGMAMQSPPKGTLPTSTMTEQPMVTTGALHGHFAEHIPIAMDRALIETGRQRFETFCAACHGVLGNGASIVATKMMLRRPPSLLDARIRGYPPGRIFQTIRKGYGLMPDYAVQISVREAWGVVAYVEALQLSRGVPAASLPLAVRAELTKEAP